ncbi:RICIN domain-containing protein [Streptomyces sp. NPDC057382]|uniref:NHL domain-containing protein n=1 Tax=unclassified Streptomyces TaxID=2593676 RepID=UPI00363F051E
MSTAQSSTGGEEAGAPIRTVAGTGAAGFKGDGEAAVSAQVNRPYGVAVDSAGTLYFSDLNNHRVRKVTTDGRISTVAGTGVAGFSGDNGPATAAQLNWPREVAVDGAGAVYIADGNNHRVRKVTPNGRISTVAGTGAAGFSGDDGPAVAARLNLPMGVAVDSGGALYISEYYTNRVRRITTDGRISTFAGTGAVGAGGDAGPAASAQLNRPHALAIDDTGALYIADYANHRIRKVTADGEISTVAGTGTAGFSGDDGPATSARLNGPVGVVADSAGVLYIADYGNHRVRMVAADGRISTVAGTGTAGFGGDGGAAGKAQLYHPYGLAVDCVDTLYVADHVNNRVRRVASVRLAGLPDSGTVVSWANVRSRLRMGVVRESVRDGAEVHQLLAVPRDHQRWRVVAAGRHEGDVLYRIENVRSGKVLEVVGAQARSGAVIAQRGYEGPEAHHQQWRLIPVGEVDGVPRVFEIANRNSGLLLRADTNARVAITQDGSEGDHQSRQWQLLPA